VHEFATTGSVLATEPADLASPGVGGPFSQGLLGEVRIRVTPADPGPDPDLFVGIGSSSDVSRYLAGVSHTRISDFWSHRVHAIGGHEPGSAPGTQDFWVASTTGPGAQTLTWDPTNGSWSVVVMNADGQPGVNVAADLGATMPSLTGIAVGGLLAGAVFLIGGVLLIVGAIRQSHASGTRNV
jgi:hypothetical protein